MIPQKIRKQEKDVAEKEFDFEKCHDSIRGMPISLSQFRTLDSFYKLGGSSLKDGVSIDSLPDNMELIKEKYMIVEYFEEKDFIGQINQIHLTFKGLWALFLYKKGLQ